MELDLGVHRTPNGLVDLTEVRDLDLMEAIEPAPGLTVENAPENPAELALVLGRHGMGQDPRKGRRR